MAVHSIAVLLFPGEVTLFSPYTLLSICPEQHWCHKLSMLQGESQLLKSQSRLDC